MSIDHKAYLFQYDKFQDELADTLYRSLQTGIVLPLRDFINRHRDSLTDAATAKRLGEDWEQKYGRDADVQRYADLALNRYYDLTASLGLGYGFDALAVYLRSVPSLARHAECLIGGRLFGPKGKRLDPGLMGTGLLSPAEVARFARFLARVVWPTIPGPESEVYSACYYQPESAADIQRSLDELRELYRRAAQASAGILLVDFNDCGVGGL
jgi:hypothetical protein